MIARRAPRILWLAAVAACGGSTRDVVPETLDVRVLDAGAGAQREGDGYVYLARRPLAAIGLAEARGIPDDVARAAVDRLADALDACVTEQGRKGTMVGGAARVVALVDANGAIRPDMLVKVDPGAAASTGVLCLVWPIKQLTFPPASEGGPPEGGLQRGMAIEALWGASTVTPSPVTSSQAPRPPP